MRQKSVYLIPTKILWSCVEIGVSAGPDGESMSVAHYVDEALGQGEIRRPFEEAPHILTAGATAALMSTDKMQVAPRFWRLDCPARGGRFLQVLCFDPGALQKPSRSLGCFLRLTACYCRSAEVHSDG